MDYDDIKVYIQLEKTIEKYGPILTYTSKVVSSCQHCGADKHTSVRQVRDYLKKGKKISCIKCGTKNSFTKEKREKQSQISSTYFADSNNRKKTSDLVKHHYVTPGNREKQSERSVKMMQDESIRQKISVSMTNVFSDVALTQKYSSDATDRWNTKEYSEKTMDAILVKNQDPIYKENHSKASLALWDDPSFQLKMNTIMSSIEYSNKQKDVWDRPGYREYQSGIQTIIANTSEVRMKLAARRAEFLASGRRSSIETVTNQLLTLIGVVFEEQKQLGPWTFDFYLPHENMYIECQGEYWHSLDRAKANDSAKYSFLEKSDPWSKILYLYERDFLNPGIVKQKLINSIYDTSVQHEPILYVMDDLVIKPLSVKDKLPKSYYSAPEEFLQTFHYAGYGRSAKKIHGVYLDNTLIAICKFAGIVRKEVATSMGLKHSEVMELDRFCIHPQYQKKNLASWVISRCSKNAFDEFPQVTTLISFADSTFGHSGTIYKASNWTELHKTRPDYYYVNTDGFIMHKKTLWDHATSMKKTESDYADEFGYVKVFGKEKTKFMLKRP